MPLRLNPFILEATMEEAGMLFLAGLGDCHGCGGMGATPDAAEVVPGRLIVTLSAGALAMLDKRQMIEPGVRGQAVAVAINEALKRQVVGGPALEVQFGAWVQPNTVLVTFATSKNPAGETFALEAAVKVIPWVTATAFDLVKHPAAPPTKGGGMLWVGLAVAAVAGYFLFRKK